MGSLVCICLPPLTHHRLSSLHSDAHLAPPVLQVAPPGNDCHHLQTALCCLIARGRWVGAVQQMCAVQTGYYDPNNPGQAYVPPPAYYNDPPPDYTDTRNKKND